MKRTILFLLTISLWSALSSAVDAQQSTQKVEKPSTPKTEEKSAGQTPVEVLGRFKDTEAVTLILREGPYINFTTFIAFAEFPQPNVVSFKTAIVKPPEPLCEVTLTYERTKKVYLLSMSGCFLRSRGEFGPSVKDLPLTFVEGTGFSGKGTSTFKGHDLNVEAEIKQKDLDNHEWEVTFLVGDQKAFRYSFGTAKKKSK
jgi:hypothetical protein